MNVHTALGSDPVERVGSVMLIVGLALLLFWLFGQTELDRWVRSAYERSSYFSELFCMKWCEGERRWAWRLIIVGLALRLLAKPAWRWLRTGRVKGE